MTKEIRQSRQFKRDLKLSAKQGKDVRLLYAVVHQLANEEPLEHKHKPHRLSGNWVGFWECHIQPDWLLVYKLDNAALTLYRTGTHAKLFNK